MKPIWFPGTFIVACVICAAVGFKHSSFVSAVWRGLANLHLNYIRPYTTICPFLVYLYRPQLKNRVVKYFLVVLWTSVTWHFILLFPGKKKPIFFFSPVFRWLFMVFMNMTWFWYYYACIFFIAVLISIAAIVPRLFFKNTQVVLWSFVFRFHM